MLSLLGVGRRTYLLMNIKLWKVQNQLKEEIVIVVVHTPHVVRVYASKAPYPVRPNICCRVLEEVKCKDMVSDWGCLEHWGRDWELQVPCGLSGVGAGSLWILSFWDILFGYSKSYH